MKPQIFQFKNKFRLEQGDILPSLNLAYHTYGKLNEGADNVIWICHALTANSEAADWWPGMIGPGKVMDPDTRFIVCANMIGSCYGSTGPASTNPETGLPWFREFPELTIRDQVNAFDELRKHLGIQRIHTLIGGSVGASQALEYSIMYPGLIDNLVFIASSVKTSPWAIAFNQSQRLAIEADPSYEEDRPYGGNAGLKAARSIALLSYRNEAVYAHTQGEKNELKTKNQRASSYQNYQGEKLVQRFDAYSYHALTRIMDTHNIVRERGSLGEAAGRIKARVLAVGLSTDQLFPVYEQKLLAHLCNGSYCEIDSFHGHDGFLIETAKLSSAIRAFWKEKKPNRPRITGSEIKEDRKEAVPLSLN